MPLKAIPGTLQFVACHPVRLTGPRITLRELALDDWPAVHAHASLLEVCRFQAWGPNTPGETQAFVEESES